MDRLNRALKNGRITPLGSRSGNADKFNTINIRQRNNASMFEAPSDRKQYEVSYSPERTDLIKRMKQRRDERN